LPCQHIRDEKGCNIYETRPEICRKYKGGDFEKNIIPFCGWYEPLPEEIRYKVMRNIEWADKPKVPAT
jgi:Fe-S-cluster containining protein